MARTYRPLVELTVARIREFVREPGAVFWVFGFPILMAVGLGLAFRHRPPPRPQVAVVVDQAAEAGSAAWMLAALEAADAVGVTQVTPQGCLEQLKRGRVDICVAATGTQAVTYTLDGTRDEAQAAKLVLDNLLNEALGRQDRLTTAVEPITQKGFRYIDFLVPGLIALNIMSSSLWGIGYSLVLQRKRGLLRRLVVSPMRRWHFLAAYGLSRLIFLVVEVVTIVAFGALVFDVVIQGSVLLFAVLALAGACTFAAIGILIGARIESLEAANGWLNFAMLPMWLLSGSFFSYERFPEWLHTPIQALPLTALNDGLRAVCNDGAGLAQVAPPLAVLSGWAVVCFFIALRKFRWQ